MSNPFLTKKDPLLESVKTAMQDGEYRRQAEAYVNEQFGVYSRKAVIREQLAAYDAALEEAYKCMKEGKPLADKDYDKDGKIETPKDEVWGSRLRAAKMAGKLKEGVKADPNDPSYQGGGDVTMSAPKHVTPTNPERIKNFKDPRDSSVQGSGDVTMGGKPASVREEQMAEATYSAKAARAGKDIGKPGKQFAKIAAKAGEKYGSEERGKKVAGAILKKIRAKHMKEDQSFNAAQETGKSVNEVVAATAVPPTYQPTNTQIERPAAKTGGAQRLQGTRYYRGINATSSGRATAQFATPQTARASGPAPKTGTSLVPSGGNRLPVASGSAGNKLPAVSGGSGASRGLPAVRSGSAMTGSSKAPITTTYTRLGDKAISTGGSAVGKLVPKAAGVASKALGPIGTLASLVTPDATKTEPGNPVFRKTDAGKGEVAGYRSATTPRKTDVNTQDRAVGDMSRRGRLAPSVRNQELPSKIAPVQTKEPGTMSAPVSQPAQPAKQTFGQAFAAARTKAAEIGAKSSGSFEFGGKKFQTNLAPAKGSEKYVPSTKQTDTGIKAEPTTKSADVPLPPSRPSDLDTTSVKPAASTPKATTDNTPSNAQTQTTPNATSSTTPDEKKAKGSVSTMNESVQVGDKYYRIV